MRDTMGESTINPRTLSYPGSHPCAAVGGADVRYAFCLGISGTPVRNQHACTGCLCPWRICRVCVLEGVKDERAWVADAPRGLCTFHLDNGERAMRPKGGLQGTHHETFDSIPPMFPEDAARSPELWTSVLNPFRPKSARPAPPASPPPVKRRGLSGPVTAMLVVREKQQEKPAA